MYCFNVLPAIDTIEKDIQEQVNKSQKYINGVDLKGFNEKQEVAFKEYLNKTISNHDYLRGGLIEAFKSSCREVDKYLDERAAQPYRLDNLTDNLGQKQ